MAIITPVFDPDMLKRFLSAVMPNIQLDGMLPTECFELCVLHGQFAKGGRIESADLYNSTLGGWYNCPHKLAVDARRLDGVSAYIVFNPIDTALLGRADNRLIRLSSRVGRTSDENVTRLRWLYIDIDAVRPKGISSTDVELQHALSRRDAILSDFPDLRDSSLWGCSGNGGWILARLPDYPNDVEHKQHIAEVLTELAGRYTDNVASIDVSTKNPARLSCLPGTVKSKGENRPERPWRLVTLDTPVSAEKNVEKGATHVAA